MGNESPAYKYGLEVIQRVGWPPIPKITPVAANPNDEQHIIEGELLVPTGQIPAINWLAYDHSVFPAELYPTTIDPDITNCQGRPFRMRQVATNSVLGEEKSIIHAKHCQDCYPKYQDLLQQYRRRKLRGQA